MISLRRMCSPHQWRQWLAMVVSLDESPWRMALALAVGVFISFTPFWGFQTLLALVVATVGRLNPALTIAGTWLNLPWFAPFVYAGAVKSDRRCCRIVGSGRLVGVAAGRHDRARSGRGRRDVARRLQRAPRAARPPRADRMLTNRATPPEP